MPDIDLSSKRLIIFDVDNMLVKTKSGHTFRRSADDWEWLPDRLKKLQELKEQGKELAVATNQGGVAFGFLNEDDMQTELSILCNQGQISYLRVCFAHPNASAEGYREEIDLFDRKPMPGMLLKIVLAERITVPQTLMVGDRDEDKEAAKNAGMDFMTADQFFGDGEPEIEDHPF